MWDWCSPTQREVFEYGPAPACASGGFGSGKTQVLSLKALWLSDMYPGNRGVIARRVYEELKHTTMATFYKLCPPAAYGFGGKRSDSEKYLRLNNGSEVLFMHLDDPQTENVIRGLEINWFLLDQAEEIDESLFDLLLSRLGRWDKATVPQAVVDAHGGEWAFMGPDGPQVPTYPMLACNPDTELHWIYRRFHPDSPEHWAPQNGQPSYHDRGYRLFTMRSDENKFLPKHNLTTMLQQDESFVRRFVRGEWGIPEGQIHEVHPSSYIEGTPEIVEWLRRSCTLHRTLDHGDASPTACIWWAVDRDGNVFAFREYYQPNKLISDHRKEISALSQGEMYTLNLADPSIFFKTTQKHGGRWSVSDEYADSRNLPRETALYWQAADNNELGTRNRVSEYLRFDPERIHPVTKEKGSPRLFFVKKSKEWPQGVDHLPREVRSQRRERIGTDMGKPVFSDERDGKIVDHAYDCLRYFVASRPPVAVELSKRFGAKTFYGVRRRHLDWVKSGGPKRRQRELLRHAS